MKERLSNPSNAKKVVAGLLLSAIALTGCHRQGQKSAPDTTTTTLSMEARGGQLWSQALADLRNKVASHQAVKLFVAKGICLYWPASVQGIDTVIRDPALYRYQDGGDELSFLPFIPSSPKSSDLVIMNGPFEYDNPSRGPQSYGNLGAVSFSNNFQLFKEENGVFTLQQAEPSSVFTPAWLQAADGSKVSQTQLIEDKDLQSAFAGSCHLQPLTTQA